MKQHRCTPMAGSKSWLKLDREFIEGEGGLKKRVKARRLFHLKQLEEYATEEWAKKPSDLYLKLIENYPHRLKEVIKHKEYTIDVEVSIILKHSIIIFFVLLIKNKWFWKFNFCLVVLKQLYLQPKGCQ